MSNRDRISELWHDLEGLIPNDLRHVSEDVKKNLRVLISSALARANMITREEYEDQVRQLARVRDSLDKLEERIAALEREKATEEGKGRK